MFAAGFQLNRDLVNIARNSIRMNRPPTIAACIAQRHVDDITQGSKNGY